MSNEKHNPYPTFLARIATSTVVADIKALIADLAAKK